MLHISKAIKRTRLVRYFLLFISSVITIHSFIFLFATQPASAADQITYKWSPTNGNQIIISGGSLKGNQTINVSNNPSDKLSGTTISPIIQSTATYTTGALWWQETKTADCYVPLTINFTSESGGSVKINKGYSVASGSGQGPTQCSAYGSGDSTTSLFDAKNFTISGTRQGGDGTQETAAQKTVNIYVYPGTKTADQVPVTLTINVSGQITKSYQVTRSAYNANNKVYFSFSTSQQWDPGTYTVCLDGTPSLGFGCQSFTKEKFKTGSVVFGSYVVQGETSAERIINVQVKIVGSTLFCSTWTFDSLGVVLKNPDGTGIQEAETDPYTNTVSSSCQLQNNTYTDPSSFFVVNTQFNDMNAGTYKICLKNDSSVCTTVTKNEGQPATATLTISGQKAADLLAASQAPKAYTTSCSVNGLGWLICPAVTFLSNIADSMFSVLADNFLKVGVNVLNQDSSKGPTVIYNAWRVMQGLANVILIIIFLIFVFSQVSNVGVSKYGLRKMAPRLVVGAIIINLSFFICSIGIDLSNILGYGIRDFFDSLASNAVSSSTHAVTSVLSGQVTNQNHIWSSVAGGILAIAGIALAGYFMLSLLGTLLLAALIVLVVILLILVGRQAIIILAIILAPVAIALWLLPNTERLAKQWGKIFFSMLLVFPIIATLFGASTFVSIVMTYAFGGIEGINKDNANWLGQIMAAGIQVLPLVATPFILLGALKSVPVVGGFASRIANRSTGNFKGKVGQSYQQSTFAVARKNRLGARQNWQAQKVAQRIGQQRGITSVFTRGIGITKSQKYANRSVAASALTEAAAGDAKDVSAEQNALIAQRMPIAGSPGNDLTSSLSDAVRNGDLVKTRAIQNILLKTESGRKAYHEAMSSIDADGTISDKKRQEAYESMRKNIKFNHSDIKGVDAAIDTFSNAQSGSLQDARNATAFDNLSDAQLAGQSIGNVRQAGGLSSDPVRAIRMLENPNLKGMNQEVRSYLEKIAAGKS